MLRQILKLQSTTSLRWTKKGSRMAAQGLDWSNQYPEFRQLEEVPDWNDIIFVTPWTVVKDFWQKDDMLARSIMDSLFRPLLIRLIDSGVTFERAILTAAFQVQVIRQRGNYQRINNTIEADELLTCPDGERHANGMCPCIEFDTE